MSKIFILFQLTVNLTGIILQCLNIYIKGHRLEGRRNKDGKINNPLAREKINIDLARIIIDILHMYDKLTNIINILYEIFNSG